MPLVDLDDPVDLRARWSALAAVAHATGYDRRWWADEIGWHHEDPAGNDLRMVVMDDDRAVLFGYHVEYSQTGGSDLLGGAPEWIAQPEVRHRISTGELGFVYGQFSGTWARAGYPGDPWQPIDDGFMAVGSWLTADEETAAELVEWAAEWADFLGSTDQAMSAGLQLVEAAGSTGISSDHLLDLFDLLGIGPGSPRHPDLAAALHAAAAFGGPVAEPQPVQTAQPANDWEGGDAFARLGLMDAEPEDAGYYADQPVYYPEPGAPGQYAEYYPEPGQPAGQYAEYYPEPDQSPSYAEQPAPEPYPQSYAGPHIEDYNDLFADSVQPHQPAHPPAHPAQPPAQPQPTPFPADARSGQPPGEARFEAGSGRDRAQSAEAGAPDGGSEREPVVPDDRTPSAVWQREPTAAATPTPFVAPGPVDESEPSAEQHTAEAGGAAEPRPTAEPQVAKAIPDPARPSATPEGSQRAAEPTPEPTAPRPAAPGSVAPAGLPAQAPPTQDRPAVARTPTSPATSTPAHPAPGAAPGSGGSGSVPSGGGVPPASVPVPPVAAKANGANGDGRSPRRHGRGPAGVPEQRPEPQPASKLVFPSFIPPVVEEPPAAPAGSLEASMRAEPERSRPRPARTEAEELLHEWCLARTRVVPSGFTIEVQALDPTALAFSFDLQPPPVPGMDRIGGLLRDLWQAEAHAERGGWLFARIDAAGRTLRIDRWYDQIPPWWEHDLDDSVDVPGLLRRLGDRTPQWRPSYLNRLPADAR